MIAVLMAICAVCGDYADEMHNPYLVGIERSMTQSERDRIWNEIHFAVKKMNSCMNRAEREVQQIYDIDVRDATFAVIEGAICGLGGGTAYSVVIGGCLGGLARIGANSHAHFRRAQDHVRDAESYAMIADDLQERLWRDK